MKQLNELIGINGIRCNQQTFQEAKVLAMALANGPSHNGWSASDYGGSLIWSAEGEPFQIKFDISLLPDSDCGETADGFDLLKVTGIPAVLLLHTLISIAKADDNRTVSIKELAESAGLEGHISSQRDASCRRVMRILDAINAMSIHGNRRKKYNLEGKQVDVTIGESLLIIKPLTGENELTYDSPFLGVYTQPGKWLDNYRKTSSILSYLGDTIKIAKIPSGKASGAWAQCFALALQQRWRERANRPDRRDCFKREEVFELFPPAPEFDPRLYLNGEHPSRAIEYWNKAIQILKNIGIVGSVTETRYPGKRQGWQRYWLNETVVILPGDEVLFDLGSIVIPMRRSS